MHTQIQQIINRIHNSERYSDDYRQAWSDLFTAAKQQVLRTHTATKYNKSTITRDNDDLAVQILVDNWMAYDDTAFIKHSHPDDNRVADDQSCMRNIVTQKREFCNDILREIIKTTDPATRTRLWNLYDSEIRTELSSADYAIYAEFSDATQFADYAETTDFDECFNHRAYRDSIHQDPECDPDNARFIGTPPKRDLDGCITFDSRMRSNYIDKGRGAGGVLNGLYTNTQPEPNFRTKQQSRLLRSALLNSDNTDDIKTGTYMKTMTAKRRANLIKNKTSQWT